MQATPGLYSYYAPKAVVSGPTLPIADSLAEWARKLDGSDYFQSFGGLYDANSSLLLLRAPCSIFVRLGLPEENFVGFVNGENKTHPRTAPETLPLRPRGLYYASLGRR